VCKWFYYVEKRNISDQKTDSKCQRLPGRRRRILAAAVAGMLMEHDSTSDSNTDAESSSDFSDMDTEDNEDDDDDDLTIAATDSAATDSSDGDNCRRRHLLRTLSTAQGADEWSWNDKVQLVTVTFSGRSRLKNMPPHLNAETSDMIDFLNLFLDNELLNKMVECTNQRAQQTKSDKPKDYYAQRWFDVTVAEMR